MAVLKGVTRSKRQPVYSGKFMIDTVRGVLRVRKWPRKRGTPKSAAQLYWIDWFRQANRLAKYVDGASAARAIEITAKSGMYPRDILLAAMRGRLYTWYDQNGKVWNSMAAIQDISDSLDVLAQNIGSVLVRAADRWRAPPVGNTGEVLTHKGPGLPPEWATVAATLVQEYLTGTPITPAGTVSEYFLDVSLYASVVVTLDFIALASSDSIKAQFSTDGGATYHAGASDYFNMYVSSAAESTALATSIGLSDAASAANHAIMLEFLNLRALRSSWQGMCSISSSSARSRTGYTKFAGPITHIRLFTTGAVNFSSGNIKAIGLRG